MRVVVKSIDYQVLEISQFGKFVSGNGFYIGEVGSIAKSKPEYGEFSM